MKKKKREVFQSPSDQCWQAMEDALEDARDCARRGQEAEALESFDNYCISRMRAAYKGRLAAIVRHPNTTRQSRIEEGMTLMLAQMDSEKLRIEAANYFLDRGFSDVLKLRRRS